MMSIRMEDKCTYVSSRGLLKSTDIHIQNPQSSCRSLDPTLYSNLVPGSSIYICNSALPNFVQTILPLLSVPFVLVSGDSDNSMPYDIFSKEQFDSFISDPRLHHWFCQNLLISHPKMTPIPIGLDYHTMSKVGEVHPWGAGKLPQDQEKELEQAIKDTPPINERHLYCYSNFHHATFGLGSRGDRQEVIAKVPKEIVFYDPVFTSRDVAWNHQSFFSFVLSPKGGGYDCHRTWEALCLGCIPIVKKSGLEPLFANLPVLCVNEWSDVTRNLLVETLVKFSLCQVQKEKLLLSYWVSQIRQKSDESRQIFSSNTLHS